MKILGVRCSSQKTRYALVDWDGEEATLLNADTESRLMYPTGMDDPDEQVGWLYQEMERIFHDHKDIDKVVMKVSEYGLREKKANRNSSYAEAIVLLASKKASQEVTVKTYASLSTRSADVRDHAESRVGKTNRYWDTQMADAVVAAWSGRE